MTADRGTLNEVTHDLELFGNVHVADGDQTAQAEHLFYNTASGDVRMDGVVTATIPATPPPATHAPATHAPATRAPMTQPSPGHAK